MGEFKLGYWPGYGKVCCVERQSNADVVDSAMPFRILLAQKQCSPF